MLNFVALITIAHYSIKMDENIIENNCNFNTVRFNRNDVMCADYGVYKKYCKSYYMPYEFIVTKEHGLNYKLNYNIEPKAIFEEYSNKKTVLANIYYRFTCSNEDNEPKLMLNIVPLNDMSFENEFVDLCFMVSFGLSAIIIIKCVFN